MVNIVSQALSTALAHAIAWKQSMLYACCMIGAIMVANLIMRKHYSDSCMMVLTLNRLLQLDIWTAESAQLLQSGTGSDTWVFINSE